MFTGLVECKKIVKSLVKEENLLLIEIERPDFFDDIKIGSSIAVNGICMTIVKMNESSIFFQAIKETIDISNIKFLHIGDFINLERALKASERFEGHIVGGHVENMAKITNIENNINHIVFEFEMAKKYEKYLLEKNFIAINGTSLTIQKLITKNDNCYFYISIIPHTKKIVNLLDQKIGDYVNIEFDIVVKHIIKLGENYAI